MGVSRATLKVMELRRIFLFPPRACERAEQRNGRRVYGDAFGERLRGAAKPRRFRAENKLVPGTLEIASYIGFYITSLASRLIRYIVSNQLLMERIRGNINFN